MSLSNSSTLWNPPAQPKASVSNQVVHRIDLPSNGLCAYGSLDNAIDGGFFRRVKANSRSAWCPNLRTSRHDSPAKMCPLSSSGCNLVATAPDRPSPLPSSGVASVPLHGGGK
ncbi:hypothetical protein SUGI_0993650 [Cryptomeria japonica]|nr:hypothetical protein SUGI_0993650 [Cryptomeria japonica]